jgi:hypothetical protein
MLVKTSAWFWVGDAQLAHRVVDVLIRPFAERYLHNMFFLSGLGITAHETEVVADVDTAQVNVIATSATENVAENVHHCASP